jgi:hypothetical protein
VRASGGEPATSGPITGATNRLVNWLSGVVSVPVRAGPPAEAGSDRPGVAVWPIALLPERAVHGVGWRGREPFRLQVRHLVTAGGEVEQVGGALDQVLLALLDARDLVLHLEPVPPQLWLALRVQPRAAIHIDVPAQVARSVPPVPVVRSPLRVQDIPLRPLRGRVLGPRETPLSGIRVEVVATGTSTYTGTSGEFSFTGLPADQPTRLLLSGKSRALLADLMAPPGGDPAADPFIIHCDLEEV